jgi:hypothetical protein
MLTGAAVIQGKARRARPESVSSGDGAEDRPASGSGMPTTRLPPAFRRFRNSHSAIGARPISSAKPPASRKLSLRTSISLAP